MPPSTLVKIQAFDFGRNSAVLLVVSVGAVVAVKPRVLMPDMDPRAGDGTAGMRKACALDIPCVPTPCRARRKARS